MINNVKLMLGDSASNYTDELINLALEMAKAEVEDYCGRALDKVLEHTAQRIAVIMLNRQGTEGVASQSFSGVSESFIDGLPADIKATLNRKRLIKVV